MSAEFKSNWAARVLTAPPMIAPVRQFVYPQFVPGEEDAMGRGALLVEVKPAAGGMFLATCALGFKAASLPSGVWACPRADDLLAVAGGYAYLIDTARPEGCLHLPLRPVTQVMSAPEDGVIVLAGHTTVAAIGAGGLLWESGRVSWEGVTLTSVRGGEVRGLGWDMRTDKELEFVMSMGDGSFVGGGF